MPDIPTEWFENTKIEGISHRLTSLKKEKIIIPIGFFEKVENSKELYLEALKSYLYNLPNSSLIQIVRCGEIAIRKGLKMDGHNFINIKTMNKLDKQVNVEEASFFEMIEAQESRIYNRDVLNYLRTLRNKVHGTETIKESDALYALDKITKELNFLFNAGSVNLSFICPYNFCRQNISHTIPLASNFIGNEFIITCPSSKHNRLFIGKKIKIKLDSLTSFSTELV